MLDIVLRLLEFTSGLIITVAAALALATSPRREVSLRTVAAMLIGAGGAMRIGNAVTVDQLPNWLLLVLPVGLALWLVHAGREHLRKSPSRPSRRVSDALATPCDPDGRNDCGGQGVPGEISGEISGDPRGTVHPCVIDAARC